MAKAIGWLAPFAVGKLPWSLPDLDGMKAAELGPVLRQAALALPSRDFGKAAEEIGPVPDPRAMLFLE